jgi:hypothetical protein
MSESQILNADPLCSDSGSGAATNCKNCTFTSVRLGMKLEWHLLTPATPSFETHHPIFVTA